MKEHFIQLNTPAGPVYIKADAIIAVSQVTWMNPQTARFKSHVWMAGQEDAFEIVEDVDTIMKRIFP